MPHIANQAGQAIAANPQNAAAILNQLMNSPDNRSAPPAYWFMLMNQHTAANIQQAALAAKTLSHLTQAAGNPANLNDNLAFGLMLQANAAAAQRDMEIGAQLEAIRQSNQDLMQRLAMDVQMVEATNEGIKQYNDRTIPVLSAITGVSLGADPEKWKSWWSDQLGYVYQESAPEAKPTFTAYVASQRLTSSCFAAGTLVQTLDGPRPIESIRSGDRVLSQNTATGALSFHPVIATHHSAPAQTIRLTADHEVIVATGIHRFWKAGKGWTMARELKAGDRLRVLGGVVEVESIEADSTQSVFNLDVAGDRDFFVGTKVLLVHDFSFVQPVLDPFDAPKE
jgi:hypothetical protein